MISSIIVGAGKSKRFKSVVPKIFYNLHGKKIIEYSLEIFQKADNINEIILVLPSKYIDTKRFKTLKKKFCKLKCIVPGGQFREESVYNGLVHCSEQNKIVLIHDGARPLVNIPLIKKVINNTKIYGACIPVYEIFGSVKTIKNNFLEKTLKDTKLFVAQTPQGFNKDLLISLMEKIKNNFEIFPDESSIFKYFGYKVKVISGNAENIKITIKDEFKIINKIL
ncbi:MAG: 2-C-methyl-D-erythritol 4-phosphate cytidylyltransferase [Candidatus Omnitrophica bacterium]|jgi:2-C-methyl-D-erythritol 4-phosphate cytidylyltransferase|nr:2-C-methyl-D-erythritol 4-phosphate cytidylyltransferase [Candidatus Omnitrophota bacterium]